jgi:hypothetical protein
VADGTQMYLPIGCCCRAVTYGAGSVWGRELGLQGGGQCIRAVVSGQILLRESPG